MTSAGARRAATRGAGRRQPSIPTSMPTLPTLRTASPHDVAAVERLLTQSELPTVGIAELFTTRAGDFVVADDPERPGELVAVAGLERCGHRDDCGLALLRSVAVRPEWRRHGLGHALVERVVEEAERRGLQALYLLTTTAERYFPRFGFQAVARDRVPAEVQATEEFSSACPASATVMARPLAARAVPA